MKKKLVSMGICVAILLLFFANTHYSIAATAKDYLFGENGATNVEEWEADNSSGLTSSTKRVMGTIINVIRIVGIGVAIIMMTYVAIKYMSAAPQEKAEFKKSATAMVVGAIVLFAASGILTIIANFASSNIKTA